MQAPRRIHVLRSAVVAVGALLLLPAQAAALTLTPESPASPNAADTQLAYVVMVIVAVAVSLAVIVGLLAAVRRGRDAGGEERRTRGTSGLQRKVGAALGLLALAAFVFGIFVTESAIEIEPNGPDGLEAASLIGDDAAASTPPPGPPSAELEEGADAPIRILAASQQWLWRYEYPDGTFSYYDLVVPVDTTVVLDVESVDLVHRWWVPALAPMTDATPGSANEVWFKAEEVGEFEGRSTEFSGPAYPTLRTRVVVLPQDEFRAWLEQQAAEIQEAQGAVQERVQEGTAPGVALQAPNVGDTEDPEAGDSGSDDADGTDPAAGSGDSGGSGSDPADEEASP